MSTYHKHYITQKGVTTLQPEFVFWPEFDGGESNRCLQINCLQKVNISLRAVTSFFLPCLSSASLFFAELGKGNPSLYVTHMSLWTSMRCRRRCKSTSQEEGPQRSCLGCVWEITRCTSCCAGKPTGPDGGSGMLQHHFMDD